MVRLRRRVTLFLLQLLERYNSDCSDDISSSQDAANLSLLNAPQSSCLSLHLRPRLEAPANSTTDPLRLKQQALDGCFVGLSSTWDATWGSIIYRRHRQIFYLLVDRCDLHRPVAPPATATLCSPSPGASDFVASATHRR
jgi:hypothetical protein